MNARIMDTSFADQGYRGHPSDFDDQHPETISYLKWQQQNWKKNQLNQGKKSKANYRVSIIYANARGLPEWKSIFGLET